MSQDNYYRYQLIKYLDDKNNIRLGRFIRCKNQKYVIKTFEPLGHYIEVEPNNVYPNNYTFNFNSGGNK